jgi:hypothetical protein
MISQNGDMQTVISTLIVPRLYETENVNKVIPSGGIGHFERIACAKRMTHPQCWGGRNAYSSPLSLTDRQIGRGADQQNGRPEMFEL